MRPHTYIHIKGPLYLYLAMLIVNSWAKLIYFEHGVFT